MPSADFDQLRKMGRREGLFLGAALVASLAFPTQTKAHEEAPDPTSPPLYPSVDNKYEFGGSYGSARLNFPGNQPNSGFLRMEFTAGYLSRPGELPPYDAITPPGIWAQEFVVPDAFKLVAFLKPTNENHLWSRYLIGIDGEPKTRNILMREGNVPGFLDPHAVIVEWRDWKPWRFAWETIRDPALPPSQPA